MEVIEDMIALAQIAEENSDGMMTKQVINIRNVLGCSLPEAKQKWQGLVLAGIIKP